MAKEAKTKIIDWEKLGNVIRFYLGDAKTEKYWGDDWDDTPYECNAGRVYDEFVVGYRDVAVPIDYLVLEPADDYHYVNTPYCKNDMIDRRVPCIIIVKDESGWYRWENNFSEARDNGDDVVCEFYFGDPMEPGREFWEDPQGKSE